MTELAIQTRGLTRRFGLVLAVDKVDLEVPAGSVYGYLGLNGAGKTTTIQMLMGMLRPSAGEISVMGFNPLREEVPLKRVVSYMPERLPTQGTMRVRDLMWMGAGLHPNWDGAWAEELRKRLELPADRQLRQLSRGMQGKAALMTALAPHPRLLVLDDPTAGLDALVRREFIHSIIGVLQESGVTVFFSSHIIDDVERVADRIGLLHGGKLIVQAPLEELKRSIKRLAAAFPGEAPEIKLPGLLLHETIGRQHAFTCRDCSDSLIAQLRAAGATEVEVEDCSLEDVFVALVRSQMAAAVAA